MSGIKLSLKEEILPLICSSCGKIIHPREKSVMFRCPNCGDIEIIRCASCRKQGITYICPKCGFEGP
ncbi:MAG: zinc finger domain-containing protein [Sulfolobaceae archaeon]